MIPDARVSVVIPTFNEAERLPRLLERLARMPALHEVIVVDGGSADDTVARAEAFSGVRVLAAGERQRGRGNQLDLGARAATGSVLWFVHADALPPRAALRWIERALARPNVVAGAFRTRTVADDRPGLVGRLLWLADVRSRLARRPYGDQALFVRHDVYFAAGGFPPWPLFEDVALADRLLRVGAVRVVPATVEVSGRRFLARPIRATFWVHVLPLLFRLGASPNTLARLYRA